MDKQDQDLVKKMIEEAIDRSNQLRTKKRGDIPTDSYHLTPQGYVNMNGTIANRPVSPVVGQQYYVTSIHYPIYSDGVSSWFSASGSVVASL